MLNMAEPAPFGDAQHDRPSRPSQAFSEPTPLNLRLPPAETLAGQHACTNGFMRPPSPNSRCF
jgi:hypothetical protein